MPTTPEFQKQYAALNPRQKVAVDAIDGPVMVLAGPGTGKTAILTVRIANILAKTDITPDAILALTFTENAAAEMRGRLAALIGPDAYRVTVTTFHAFCNNIIQDYSESFPELAGAIAASDADQAGLVEELLRTLPDIDLLRPVNAPELYLRDCMRAFDSLKREGVSPDAFSAILVREKEAVAGADDLYHEKGAYKGKMKGEYAKELERIGKLEQLATLYRAYQEALRAAHLYDYNDMVLEAARALEKDEPLRLSLQEQYQYVLVDEHQDTNNAQNKIIELLASFWEQPNLFIVGDAKQAIFRFQGASLQNFLYFKDKYPSVVLVELENNYRSTQSILDAAHSVLTSPVTLQSQAKGGRPISVMAFSDEDTERFAVAKQIQLLLEAGTQPQDIAVLVRSNGEAGLMGTVLASLAVPYEAAGNTDAFGDSHIQQLLAVLTAVVQFGEPEKVFRALAMPILGIDPLDQYKLADFCRKGRNPLDIMRSTGLMHEAGIEAPDVMLRVAGLLTGWARRATTTEPLALLEDIVRDSGLLEILVTDTHAADKLAKLHALYNLMRTMVVREPASTLTRCVEHLIFMYDHGIALAHSGDAARPGRVKVMTAHKSKGLEFDHVFIAGVTDKRWGGGFHAERLKLPQAVFLRGTQKPAEESDDDRNLFYVALTRARQGVTISYPQRDAEGHELIASRYLADIKEELIARPDTSPWEQEWNKSRDITFRKRPAVVPDARNKEFLNQLFLKQGLSVTALNNYLACPWRYFYTSLLRIPEAPAFALMYGSAIDQALTRYFEDYREGKKGTKDDLVTFFGEYIRRQPLGETQLATALTRGAKALTGWFDTYHASWTTQILNQLKVPAVPLALEDGTEIILNGKMDRVDVLDAAGTVNVVDYKTGKPKTRNMILGLTKTSDGNYWRQLVFYRLLLDRWQEQKYKMRAGILDFVEPDERGKYHREVFEVSTDDVAKLDIEIRAAAQEILDLAFWGRTCDDRDCPYCALRQASLN